MSKSVMLTAVSLHELPSSDVLREALTGFLDRHPKPSDVLRGFADMLDAGEIPVGPSPIYEHDKYLPDYRDQVHRKAFRVQEDIRDRLRALSFATGLALPRDKQDENPASIRMRTQFWPRVGRA